MEHKKINFDEYIRQGEPQSKERGIAWRTAIGDNCVIGAGSVVVKSIPENSIAAGNTCRVISNNMQLLKNYLCIE